ncbi:hypothetical protein QMM59_05690 [Leptospira santarosai]|nr:hypothetical protein [Leptospira santarosai]MDI7210034.1 hypothetical protein [Leptospira santarosai]
MKGLFAFVGNVKGDLYRMNFLSEENRRTSVLRRSLILKSLFSDFRNVFASGMILFLLCCPILEVQSESSLNLEEGGSDLSRIEFATSSGDTISDRISLYSRRNRIQIQ